MTTLRPNALLALACILVVAIQVAIPYVPPLADAFRATVLEASDWTLVALVALAPAIVAEGIRRATGRVWVA